MNQQTTTNVLLSVIAMMATIGTASLGWYITTSDSRINENAFRGLANEHKSNVHEVESDVKFLKITDEVNVLKKDVKGLETEVDKHIKYYPYNRD